MWSQTHVPMRMMMSRQEESAPKNNNELLFLAHYFCNRLRHSQERCIVIMNDVR